MKKIIRFSKAFLFCPILSVLIIASGIFVVATKGFNFGLDFRPGLVEEIKIAPAEIELTYSGSASVSVQLSSQAANLVVSGIGADNSTYSFSFIDYPTVADLANGFNTVPEVSSKLLSDGTKASNEVLLNSEKTSVLSKEPLYLHVVDTSVTTASVDEMREIFSVIPDSQVKKIGKDFEDNFQIRVGDDGSDPAISEKIQNQISELLAENFGANNYVVVKTDFIAARFSSSLVSSSAILVLLTLALIWVYATIRFKWDFALGAVLAIIHDALIMVTFIAWTQMEFDSLTVAAILTIIGYSINDTVVVLDRVRENLKLLKVKSMKELLDISQTEMIRRTIITTVTTLLAAVSLFVFTTGSMKNFALALIVGMLSGVYSTIYIAGAFIATVRKNWKPSDAERKSQVKEIELED